LDLQAIDIATKTTTKWEILKLFTSSNSGRKIALKSKLDAEGIR
jgi:hypothetical protein